jgi:Tol biopolymer transport system component
MTLLAALLAGCGSSDDAFEVRLVAPSWSADGKSIAFVANDDLYVTELGGETTRHGDLVAEDEGLDDPTRSPDGRKIAYDVCEQSEVNPYCWYSHTVVRDLENGRSLAFNQNGAAWGSCHVWSPDGKRFALLTTGEGAGTYLTVANSDGSRIERLVMAADLATSCPAWSRDGRSLAYICCGTASDVYLVDADGRRRRRLTHGMYASDVSWSPDGEQIAFHSFGEGRDGYLSIKPDGSGKVSIAPGAIGDLVWSPDSGRIAYHLRGGSDDDLFVADRDGSNRHLVAHEVCCARWSPKGDKLAFVKDDPDGEAAIYVIDASGQHLVKVSSPPEMTGS